MKGDLLERIEINPKIMFGKPVIKGTRLTVELILEKLAFNPGKDKLFQDYPFLSEEDIKAALLYAAKVLSLEETTVVE